MEKDVAVVDVAFAAGRGGARIYPAASRVFLVIRPAWVSRLAAFINQEIDFIYSSYFNNSYSTAARAHSDPSEKRKTFPCSDRGKSFN